MKTTDIKKNFCDFFIKHDHKLFPSSSLTPQNDSSVLFVNSGMFQFKDVFLGRADLGKDCNNVVSVQKCLRVGGKHNDLEQVGYTNFHQTFFEMLGSFSFGDYFKEEAIVLAWQLLTKVFCLPKDKLVVTVHKTDEEAAKIWKKVAGFSNDKIIRIDSDDNFWRMDKTGPCGPCSEIFFNCEAEFTGYNDNLLEIWNLVFMQFYQETDNTYKDLPVKCIDTGMGLERIALILQGKSNNYEIDSFVNIIKLIADYAKIDYQQNKPAFHVIADHIRASSFIISENILPSNEGRGYVLRRLLRRSMRYAYNININNLNSLIKDITEVLIADYPELISAKTEILTCISEEAIKFNSLLHKGSQLIEIEKSNLDSNKTLSGEVAFKLYDTYGFPIDLTVDALKRDGYKVDLEKFNLLMSQNKVISKKTWQNNKSLVNTDLWQKILQLHGKTNFCGYTQESIANKILAFIFDNKIVDTLQQKQEGYIILQDTPFYGEAGGQAGDIGIIKTKSGCFIVQDTQITVPGLIVHFGAMQSGSMYVNQDVIATIDVSYRQGLCNAHSATHLLHYALRKLINDKIKQQGSFVGCDYLRFDINYNKALTDAEIISIECLINNIIHERREVNVENMDYDQAISMGAIGDFTNKYVNKVRVVNIGNVAKELCGGTHVNNTSEIVWFKIINQTNIGSGIRRLEAVVSNKAIQLLSDNNNKLHNICNIFAVNTDEIEKRIKLLQDKQKQLSDRINKLEMDIINASAVCKNIYDYNVIIASFKDILINNIRAGNSKLLQKYGDNTVVILLSSLADKINIVAGVAKNNSSNISAVDIINYAAKLIDGKGGGNQYLAQAGGITTNNIKDLCNKLELEIIRLVKV